MICECTSTGLMVGNVTKSSRASDQDETITPKHVSDTKEVNDGEAKSNADSQAGDQFVCTDCGKVFKRKFNLTRHRKEMHDCTNCRALRNTIYLYRSIYRASPYYIYISWENILYRS